VSARTVYLGLGSNLGERAPTLDEALRRLPERDVEITRRSGLYETAPVGDLDQPWFLNAVAEGRTALGVRRLLEVCLEVERLLGRDRSSPSFRPGGPRTLDLDLLLYGQERIEEAGLVVPHPRLHLRRFVLAPLSEIAPDLMHPVLRRTARELLAACSDPSEVRLSTPG
jgi:2-amino-4-hydroxy-6-hydroxymethyldihydropteridine diphosphokinase